MSVELHAAEGAARPVSALGPVPETEPLDRRRPNVSGDLPTLFEAGPMFRRTVAGYDRFQVDTYVQWAEEQLATADREREHLLARQLHTQASLEEARQLLSHTSGGRGFRESSWRIGSMLAAAADQAESIRVEAEAERSALAAEADRIVARAQRVLADAEAEAARLVAEAATEVEGMVARAGRLLDEAERTGREARAQADARLDQVREIERRAAEHAEEIRRQAVEEISAARLHAREEIVRMLDTGRQARLRADAEAVATRQRLDRDAATHRASLVAEVEVLERRRSALQAEGGSPAGSVTRRTPTPADPSCGSGRGPSPSGRPDGVPQQSVGPVTAAGVAAGL